MSRCRRPGRSRRRNGRSRRDPRPRRRRARSGPRPGRSEAARRSGRRRQGSVAARDPSASVRGSASWMARPSPRGAPAARLASLERIGEAMNMRVACRTGGVGAALLLACSAPRVVSGNPQAEIAAMLQRSAADWNRGDLAGFMGDYAKDSLTSYVSGGHLQYGWQALYDHYRASYFTPGQARDSLRFEEIQVRPLTTDLAYCTARFRLTRGAAVTASGPFTLILQKRGDRWYILHDHTSSDPRP